MNKSSQDDDKCYYKVATLLKLTTVHTCVQRHYLPRKGRHNVGCMVQGRVAWTVLFVLFARVWAAKRNLVLQKVPLQLTRNLKFNKFKIVHQEQVTKIISIFDVTLCALSP